jgi:uncharacterized protein YdeI (YjbR/CyaY-like superfamily)
MDQRSDPDAPVFFDSAAEFREWLEANGSTADSLLVGFWRKAHKRGITYEEARDQALCFGWIDGVRRSIDGDRYVLRFTPRRRNSIWSRVNVGRYEELTRQGLMTPAGVAAYEAPGPRSVYSFEQERPGLDDESIVELQKHPAAWEFFTAQRPSYQRTAGHWVTSAKRPETRARRLHTLITDSASGRWIPPLRAAQPPARR